MSIRREPTIEGCTLSHIVNLGTSTHLSCMFMDSGRKLEDPPKSQARTD